MSGFLYKEVIAPWKPHGLKSVFWLDRISLICLALGLNNFLWDKGILIINLPDLLITDLGKKDEGYLYSFQTIIAAFLAFIAATLAYRYSLFDKEQRSYIAALNVRSITAGPLGTATHLAKSLNENLSHEAIYRDLYKNWCQQLYNELQLLERIDPYSLSPKVSWHIVNATNSLRDVHASLLDLTKECSQKQFELSANSIKNNKKSLEYAYEELSAYLEENVYKFPPHTSKKIPEIEPLED